MLPADLPQAGRGEVAPVEADPVVAWRIERLRDAGFSAQLAVNLARDARYDLHALLELSDRGCPAEQAARILAPLEGGHESSR